MKPEAIIVDLDGTLADCDHRRHHVDKKPKDWLAFFEAMHRDKPVFMVRNLVDLLSKQFRIVIVTGRSLSYAAVTVDWLKQHDIIWHQLLMRPDGDFRPDYEVKEDLYRTKIEPDYDVRLVLDDRGSVVAMWRRIGLCCWQVDEGAF